MARMTLHTAARRGDLEAIRSLHAADKDLDATDRSGGTALIAAACKGQVEAIELLLELGADPTRADAKGHTALAHAVDRVQDPQVFCRLVEGGCDPNTLSPESGNTALGRALGKQDAASALWLVRHRADVNLKSDDAPPLVTACMAGDVRIWRSGTGEVKPKPDPKERLRQALDEVRQFLELPPEEAQALDEETPVKLILVRLLLKAGADPNGVSDRGFTALILAAQSGNRPVVQELLKAGADVDRAFKGETALYRVSEPLRLEIVQDLLGAGADPNLAAPERGRTPLMEVIREWPRAVEDQSEAQRAEAQFFAQFGTDVQAARRVECPQACKMLLEAGADVNAQNRQGQTALMMAGRHGCTAAVEMLLDAGADPSLEDHDGKTALDHLHDDTPERIGELLQQAAAGAQGPSAHKALMDAISAGDPAAVQAALGRGADPNAQKGSPPLLAAVGSGNAEVVRLLVQAGADVNPIQREDAYVEPALVATARAGDVEILRVLLEAGTDLAAADQGRDAVLIAAAARLWEAVDVLLATGFDHPDLDAYLALRPFPATAQEPTFRGWIDRLALRLACEPAEVKDVPGVYTFSLATKEPQEKDPAAFLAKVQDDQRRKAEHQAIVAEWGDAVQAEGYHLVAAGVPVGMGSQVLLVPSPNQYAILAAMGTNGCNCGLSTPDVIRWLRQMETDHPFLIDGVRHDTVEGRFLEPIEEADALAERMYEFCPDIVDQGTGSVEALAKELARRQRFFFWWD